MEEFKLLFEERNRLLFGIGESDINERPFLEKGNFGGVSLSGKIKKTGLLA